MSKKRHNQHYTTNNDSEVIGKLVGAAVTAIVTRVVTKALMSL